MHVCVGVFVRVHEYFCMRSEIYILNRLATHELDTSTNRRTQSLTLNALYSMETSLTVHTE